jgi:hypothetical protein
MSGADTSDEMAKVASHTLAYLRSHDKKLDLILETLNRHTERLGRLERDISEMKGDIALLENKVLTAQTEMLGILHRLDHAVVRPAEETDAN